MFLDMMKQSKTLLSVRFVHWLSGFLVHIVISWVALVVAIIDWDRDCEDDNDLQISGSSWLITSEAILVLYALLLLPSFLLWESKTENRVDSHHCIVLDIYTIVVILFFTFFFVTWDTLGVFLLFEEIISCKHSGLWIMGVISLVRSWFQLIYPISMIIMREIETYFKSK